MLASQIWPVIGKEHKEVTYRTNIWDEAELIGGHDRLFVLWPFYHKATSGIGTTNGDPYMSALAAKRLFTSCEPAV